MQKIEKHLMLSTAYMFAHAWNGLHFNLTKAIIIRITESKKFDADCFATWENITDDEGREYHRITLAFHRHAGNLQELKNSIFHELVHAYQHEVGEDVDHNRSFWEWEEMAQGEGCTIRYFGDNYNEHRPGIH